MKYIYLSILVLFSSCSKPLLTNFYRKAESKDSIDISEVVAVKLGLVPIKSQTLEKNYSFINLPEKTQIQFLRVLNDKTSNLDSLLLFLKKDLKTESIVQPSIYKDEASLNFTMIVSNQKRYYRSKQLRHPNTRLSALTTIVSAVDDDYIFSEIDKLVNETEIIDIGMMSRKDSENYEISLKSTFGLTNNSSRTDTLLPTTISLLNLSNQSSPMTSITNTSGGHGMGTEGAINGSRSISFQEDINLKSERIKTGIAFDSKCISIYQEGSIMRDISNNVLLNIGIKCNKFKDTKIVSEVAYEKDSNNCIDYKSFKIKIVVLDYIPCSGTTKDIVLKLKSDGLVRATKNIKPKWYYRHPKGHNQLEYDDAVEYYYFKSESPDTVRIDKSLFCKDLFKITLKTGNDTFYLSRDGLHLYFEGGPNFYKFYTDLKETIKQKKPLNNLQFMSPKKEDIYENLVSNNSFSLNLENFNQ